MKNFRIAVIVGSLRRDSLNRQLAHAVGHLMPSHFELMQLPMVDLPPYNQDEDDKPVETVKRLKQSIQLANGLLFVTPEYNRSIPGVLKNAIDHASRPYGQSAWAGKPAGVIGISVGAPGSSMAQQHLRNVLAYLDMPTLGQPEVFLQAAPRPVRCRGRDRRGQPGLPAGLGRPLRRVGHPTRQVMPRSGGHAPPCRRTVHTGA